MQQIHFSVKSIRTSMNSTWRCASKLTVYNYSVMKRYEIWVFCNILEDLLLIQIIQKNVGAPHPDRETLTHHGSPGQDPLLKLAKTHTRTTFVPLEEQNYVVHKGSCFRLQPFPSYCRSTTSCWVLLRTFEFWLKRELGNNSAMFPRWLSLVVVLIWSEHFLET